MYQSNIKTSQHVWEKQNLVTVNRRGKMFDEMVCQNCGMKGRRYGFETVEVSESYKIESVNFCPKAQKLETPKLVKVTFCTHGRIFENITPNSIHAAVEPPKGYKMTIQESGLWVSENL